MKKKFWIPLVTVTALIALFFATGCHKRLYAQALISAIESDNDERLERLLALNGDVDATPHLPLIARWTERFNDPPLMMACRRNNANAVKLLLDHGANPNLISNDTTAFLVACSSASTNRTEILNLLLDANADVFYVNSTGATAATHFLCHSWDKNDAAGIYQVYLRLDKMGAIPSAKEHPDYIICAALGNCTEVMEHLVNEKGFSLDRVGYEGTTTLIAAVQDRSAEMVSYLLANGVDRSYVDNLGKTAYDYAVEYECNEIIALFEE